MNTNAETKKQNHRHDLQVTSIEEALNRDITSLEVPKGQEILLSPFNKEHHKYFARVNINTYQDKQNLGFIPKGLAEESARDAIAKDNDETFRAVSRMAEGQTPAKCSCRSHENEYRTAFGTALKHTYNDIRAHYHPVLSKLLSEHYRHPIPWDSPVPRLVRFWTEATTVNGHEYISLFKDVVINEGATLSLDKNTLTLFAGNISIHRTGRLVCGSGFLKIWAHSVNRLVGSLTATANIFPWRLH